MSEDEALAAFRKHTGRTTYTPPAGGFGEVVAVIGRQAGKDRIASVLQGYEAMTAFPEADGTALYSISVCQDARASLRTQFSYVRCFRHQLLLRRPQARPRPGQSVTGPARRTRSRRCGLILIRMAADPQISPGT